MLVLFLLGYGTLVFTGFSAQVHFRLVFVFSVYNNLEMEVLFTIATGILGSSGHTSRSGKS